MTTKTAYKRYSDPWEAFMARVDVGHPLGCWLWTGGRTSTGYGSMRVYGKPMKSHRFVFERLRGPVPEGLDLDHLCRVPLCVNPDHLEPVTRSTNTRRGVLAEVNRARRAVVQECPQGHPYDEENTYRSPRGDRQCRACRRERKRHAKS